MKPAYKIFKVLLTSTDKNGVLLETPLGRFTLNELHQLLSEFGHQCGYKTPYSWVIHHTFQFNGNSIFEQFLYRNGIRLGEFHINPTLSVVKIIHRKRL